MSLNSSKKVPKNLYKLQKQNKEEYKDAAVKVEYRKKRKKKGKQTKESIQKKQKKERLRKRRSIRITNKIGTIAKRWISTIWLNKVHIYETHKCYSKRDVKPIAYSSLATAFEISNSSISGREKAKESKTKSKKCTGKLY